MKVLLVNPPITSRERYGRDIGDVGGHQAPLGLCSLAASLEQEGHDVSILDAEFLGIDEGAVTDRVRSWSPGVVGLTSTSVAYPRTCRVAASIRDAVPDLPIVIGGCHVTSNPRETMESGLFDAAVLREGELTFPELIEALADRGRLDEMQGVAYLRDDEVVLTPPRPYIQDLDALPFPAFHLLENRAAYLPPVGSYKNRPVMNLVASRGCPYGCIFCDKTVFGRHYRVNSAEYVLAAVDHVVGRFGAREIAFLDDSFTVKRDRILEICRGLRRRGPRVSWTCMTRANLVDRDLLSEMKRSGCWQIAVGVESGSEEVLEFSNKGESIEEIERCIRDAAAVGIMVKGFFLIGLPKETRETLERSIAFAKSVPLTDVVVTIATPMPGSPFYRIAAEHGTHSPSGWDKLSYWWPIFVPWGLSAEHLLRVQRRFYRSFYCRMSIVGRQIRKIGGFAELLKYLRNAWRLVRCRPKRGSDQQAQPSADRESAVGGSVAA